MYAEIFSLTIANMFLLFCPGHQTKQIPVKFLSCLTGIRNSFLPGKSSLLRFARFLPEIPFLLINLTCDNFEETGRIKNIAFELKWYYSPKSTAYLTTKTHDIMVISILSFLLSYEL